MAVALAFTVGTPGCTKKEPTTDKVIDKTVDKNKKADEMVKPVPAKPKTPKESPTLEPETPKKKATETPTPPPPPIPLPKDEKKKTTDPTLPKLDLPPDSPKKDNKGASLDRSSRPSRDAVLRAAFEPRLASS
jgi:hypothetical protein